MGVPINQLDPLRIDQDFIDIVRKEIEGTNSSTHGETSISPSITDLVIQRIWSKLQISEWSEYMSNIVPKRLTSLEIQTKMEDLRSKTNRIKLQEKMSCAEGENEFEIAQQIFQAIEEGKLEVFKKLMDGKVKDWNFQLKEYGDLTPLLWTILHGQRKIVGAIREHALSKGSTKAMFWTFDKFGFRITNVAVFAYLIVPKTKLSDDDMRGIFEDIMDWGRQAKVSLGYMDSQVQKGYIPCKIYYGIKDIPDCYYVDSLGHLGFYMTPLHLAAWFAPFQATIQIIDWFKHSLKRPTGNGHTVFHLCAWKGRYDILKWLIHYTKCNESLYVGNISNNERQSPLHLAVLSQNYECMEILLCIEAIKVTMRNWKGYTPMEIATILHAASPSTITTKDLDRFGVTNFDIKSLGLAFDVINMSVQNSIQNFTTNGILSIEHKKDKKALKDIISLFDGLDPEALQKDRQVYVDAMNAILVGAALIASASFGAWLQPPLGYMEYYSNEFLVTQTVAPPGTYESYVAIKQHSII